LAAQAATVSWASFTATLNGRSLCMISAALVGVAEAASKVAAAAQPRKRITGIV